MKTQELFDFIKERHAIYTRRAAGQPKPWTKDPILQRYRFCNVYRELDTVTQWIRVNWREPNQKDPNLWFAMTVARKVNLPDSLQDIGYPVPWNPDKFKLAMRDRQRAGKPVEGAAYMITAGTGPEWKGFPKYKFLADGVFTPMWRNRSKIQPTKKDSLASFHARLQESGNTVGPFIAAQIVADVKFTKPLASALDWWTWAAPGPGSIRGLNAVCDRDFMASWKPGEWFKQLQLLQVKIDPLTREAGLPRISAQDLQNCLCEFSGYYKVKYLGPRKKQLYPGI